MIILTNPAFELLKKHYHFENTLSKADKVVLLGTYNFCKRLGHIAYIVSVYEWPLASGMAIYDSDDKQPYIEPDFFEYTMLDHYESGFYWIKNSHLSDINSGLFGKVPIKALEESDFIVTQSNRYIKRGEKRRAPICCFRGYDFDKIMKNISQIIEDTNMCVSPICRHIKIRKEFNCIW